MRSTPIAFLAALALLAACASAGGGAPGSGADPFRPCPGQDAAMAAIAGRAPNDRGRQIPIPEVTVTVFEPASPAAPPPAASPTAIPFELVLELQVDSVGRVATTPRLRRSSGDPGIDRAYTEAAREARFDPATEHAFPIPGCALWTIRGRR